MDIINVNGRDIMVPLIESVETRVVNTHKKLSQVIIRMASGEKYEVFTGPVSACEEFQTAMFTTLRASKLTLPTVNYVNVEPILPVVEHGKVIPVETFWNGAEAESSSFTYQPQNFAVAEIVLGEVLGAGVGQTEFTVTKDGKSVTGVVTVVPSKDNILFETTATSVVVGGGTLIPLRHNGELVPSNKIVYHSSNPAVATVAANGAVDVKAAGLTLIIADYNGKRYGYCVEGRVAAKAATMSVEEPAPVKKATKKAPAKKPVAEAK